MRPQLAHLYYGRTRAYLTGSLCGSDTVKSVKVLGSQWTGAGYSPSFSSSVLFPFTSCSFQNLFHLPSHTPPSFLLPSSLPLLPPFLSSPRLPLFAHPLLPPVKSSWAQEAWDSSGVWQGWQICKRLKHGNNTRSGKADKGVCCVIIIRLSFTVLVNEQYTKKREIREIRTRERGRFS